MRTRLVPALILLALGHGLGAKPPEKETAAGTPKPKTILVPNGPTIKDLRGFPLAQLRVNISPKLYKSLSISPVSAWVVAQAPSMPGVEPKIIRSDAGGIYDQFARELAKDWTMVNYDTTESRTHRPTLNVHLLIYKIADGIMAVNFSHNEEAFYAGYQRTDVWVGIWKNGQWTTIGGTKHRREYPQPTG